MKIEMKIWTMMKDGFMVLGGRCNWHPCYIIWPVEGPFDLGKGFKAYSYTAPNGKVGYVDSKSGAFIGDDLEVIKRDVAACEDVEVMKKQCKDAKKQAKDARLLDTDDFWGRLKWNNPRT